MPRFMKTLNNISRSQAIYRSTVVDEKGLCSSHHAFLLAVNRHPKATQECIANELCLNKSTVARALNTLEERGYIKREINPYNKRELLVSITEKAESVLPKVRIASKEWSERLSEGIPADEMDMFFSVLSRLEQKAKEIVKGLAEQ